MIVRIFDGPHKGAEWELYGYCPAEIHYATPAGEPPEGIVTYETPPTNIPDAELVHRIVYYYIGRTVDEIELFAHRAPEETTNASDDDTPRAPAWRQPRDTRGAEEQRSMLPD